MESSGRQGTRRRHAASAWAWAFAAFALFGLLLWSVLAPEPWGWLEPRQAILLDRTTYAVNAGEWQGARSQALRALSAAEAEALAALEAELEAHIQALFALPRSQVEAAAEWYYSAWGNLVRAGSVVGMDLGGRLIERMFPAEAWAEGQAMLVAELAVAADGHVARSGEVMLASFHRELRERRSTAPAQAEVPVFSFDVSQHAFLTQLQHDPVLERQGLVLATSALSALAARRAAQAAAARAASWRAGAAITTACASTGPGAWLCAAGVFGVTLVSTELVLMHLDELQNREEFEAALYAEIDRMQRELEAALRAAYLGALQREFDRRHDVIESRLRPIDLLFARETR